MILRMLKDPAQIVFADGAKRKIKTGVQRKIKLWAARSRWPVTVILLRKCAGRSCRWKRMGKFDCDVWWNEVARGADGKLFSTGHRIADVIALAPKLDAAIAKAYQNIRKNPRRRQLFPDGRRPKFVAAGNGLIFRVFRVFRGKTFLSDEFESRKFSAATGVDRD